MCGKVFHAMNNFGIANFSLFVRTVTRAPNPKNTEWLYIYLHELCRSKSTWDEPIPDTMKSKWKKWQEELWMLPELRIERCVSGKHLQDIARTELHHFSDASVSGHGQCSYLRQIDVNGKVHCSLIMAKARVAPLKTDHISAGINRSSNICMHQ